MMAGRMAGLKRSRPRMCTTAAIVKPAPEKAISVKSKPIQMPQAKPSFRPVEAPNPVKSRQTPTTMPASVSVPRTTTSQLMLDSASLIRFDSPCRNEGVGCVVAVMSTPVSQLARAYSLSVCSWPCSAWRPSRENRPVATVATPRAITGVRFMIGSLYCATRCSGRPLKPSSSNGTSEM